MQALTVTPRRPGTVAVSQLPEPVGADDELLVEVHGNWVVRQRE
ncbi:hypothetical protein [Mycolicibacterium hippocampi]|nr:hypothetical protein [Mycolicibacterium hippocampi]